MPYSIGEFAEIVGVNKSTLRYYEMEGLLTPHRSDNNLREYTDQDIGWVQFLLHLKDSGMTMAELKQYTEWRAMGTRQFLNGKIYLNSVSNKWNKKLRHCNKT